MTVEIERKFLLDGDGWRAQVDSRADIRQGYFFLDEKSSVRIRCENKGGKSRAWINVKQAVIGPERLEFEYAVPVDDAVVMLDALCQVPLIEKTRHYVLVDDLMWEIDEFEGHNQGLIVAEVELDEAEQELALPGWIGREVTDEQRYYNMALVRHPFSKWSAEERQ